MRTIFRVFLLFFGLLNILMVIISLMKIANGYAEGNEIEVVHDVLSITAFYLLIGAFFIDYYLEERKKP